MFAHTRETEACRLEDLSFTHTTTAGCIGKLVVADLGRAKSERLLRVWEGSYQVNSTPLADTPAGIAGFFMAGAEGLAPALAVASGSSVLVYRNLKPYFKFSLPPLAAAPEEVDIWTQVRDAPGNPPDPMGIMEALTQLREARLPLSPRSLSFSVRWRLEP